MEMKVLSKPSPIRSGLYKTSTKLYYEPSKLLEAQITEVFDDTWPTVTALKHLRWQVQGYHHEYNLATNAYLTRKFVEPEDNTNRPNLYRTCIEQKWEDQEFIIAKNLLINIFACYEAWIENILDIHGCNTLSNQKKLQSIQDWNPFLTQLIQNPNAVIVSNFYNEYATKNKNYSFAYIDKYMKILRYFKECRNCIVHRGGQTTQRVIDAYNQISIFTPIDLGIKEVPQVYDNTIDESIKISLRGVVGFSQIIIKLVSTFDIELIKSDCSQSYFLSKIKEQYTRPLTTPASDDKKKKTIGSVIAKSRFMKAANPLSLLPLFRLENILR